MKKQTQVLSKRRAIMTGMYGALGVEQFRTVATLLFKQYTSRYKLFFSVQALQYIQYIPCRSNEE